MSTYSLKLRGKVIGPNSFEPLPPLPDDVWAYVIDAGRYINYSLLLAEIFGINAAEASETISGCTVGDPAIAEMVDDLTVGFHYEDAAELAPFLEHVTARLDAALDRDDQPTNVDGLRLVAAEWVERDDFGRLRSRARGHLVSEIHHYLYHLTNMFRFAASNKLWVIAE